MSLFQWYTLNDVKSGRVRLILEWVPAVSHNDRLDQVSEYFIICLCFLIFISVAYFYYICIIPIINPLPFDAFSASVQSHCNLVVIWYSAAGDAATVSAVLQQQDSSLCSPALCLCGQSTLIACESLVIFYIENAIIIVLSYR